MNRRLEGKKKKDSKAALLQNFKIKLKKKQN